LLKAAIFTADSYACREGFGTHRALARAREGCACYRYVLQGDIRKYFPSIDHQILKDLLWRVIKCPRTLDLAARIIEGSNAQEPAAGYFPGDDLFAPFERRRGLPLGNQTSQFFANVYLNPLDHFVARELKAGAYARYVDDFLLFHDDKAALNAMLGRIEELLYGLRLTMHAGKSRAYRTRDGFTFLGWRVFPDHVRLDRSNVTRFRRRFAALHRAYLKGSIGLGDVQKRVNAWIAHAAHGDTWRLRQGIFARYKFTKRGVV
jgi:retron-type reverse transcriptase